MPFGNFPGFKIVWLYFMVFSRYTYFTEEWVHRIPHTTILEVVSDSFLLILKSKLKFAVAVS